MTGLPPDTQVLRAPSRLRALYVPVRAKFALSLTASLLWAGASYLLAQQWIGDLTMIVGHVTALLIVGGIAIVPGFMNAFLVLSLLLDRRPKADPVARFPGITILIAAYNEQDSILSTLESVERQHYPGPLQVIVVNDGSRDATATLLAGVTHPWLTVLNLERNGGKANALNRGFERARHDLVITLDGDSYLYRDALRNIVARFLADPPDTAAVAGAMLARNSRLNLVTRIQEWDYFHGIAAIKRIQSLYHGTLVAQGAFSLYRRDVLAQVGGWPECVGEDIVKSTWVVSEQYGLSTYVRARSYTDSDPYDGFYFAPERFYDYLGGIGLRRRLPVVRATLSAQIDWAGSLLMAQHRRRAPGTCDWSRGPACGGHTQSRPATARPPASAAARTTSIDTRQRR